MRLFYYIKTTLKTMVSSIVLIAVSFIIFPMIMAAFLGFMGDVNHNVEPEPTVINIVDNDKSGMSEKLIELLNSKEMEKFVKIEEDASSKLTIDKGYEENLLNLKKGAISLAQEDKNDSHRIKNLSVILDNYHQNIYYGIQSGKDIEGLNNSAIEKTIIDKDETQDSYEAMAIGMMTFVISMLMYSFIKAGGVDIAVNLDKRSKVAPISACRLYLYDGVSNFIYSGLIMIAYVGFFRISNISFKGNILDLFILIIMADVFIVGVGKCIATVFGKDFGAAIGNIIFLLIIGGSEAFGSLARGLGIVSPTIYIENAFKQFGLNGNIDGCGKWIIVTFIIGIIFFLIGLAKERFYKEGRIGESFGMLKAKMLRRKSL